MTIDVCGLRVARCNVLRAAAFHAAAALLFVQVATLKLIAADAGSGQVASSPH